MNDYIREFETYYPELLDKVAGYAKGDPCELIIKFKDGSIYSYYTPWQELREVPKDLLNDEKAIREEFGIKLRRKMYKLGILQIDLSNDTGIPQPQLSNYIKGKRLPTYTNLLKIAKALDCTLEYFQVYRKF